MTTWKNVNNNGKYEVSNNGIVRNIATGKVLMPYKNTKCNVQVGIYDGHGNRVKTFVHKLVAMAFVPNPNGYTNVHHIDGNPLNNKANNLMWVATPTYSPASMAYAKETKVAKCNPITKKVIKYYTLEELATSIYNPSYVLACCKTEKNKFKTYRGFRWEFAEAFATSLG